jgi:hypothetical protein
MPSDPDEIEKARTPAGKNGNIPPPSLQNHKPLVEDNLLNRGKNNNLSALAGL